MNIYTRDRFLWYLYDFINSIALISVIYYFSLWVVVDNGMSQWIVSLPVSLATLFLIVFMPKFARKVDRKGTHKSAMILFSVGAAVSLLLISFLKTSEYLPYVVFLTYFLFFLCFQSGYIFFTSFLNEITDESNRTKVSGIGQLWGQTGNLVGILISFVTINLTLLGVLGKQQVFLWAALIFVLMLIPMIWFRKNISTTDRRVESGEFNLSTFRKIWNNKKVFWFLIMYVLYADAMLTISFFITLYLTKGVGLSSDIIKIAGICLLLGTIVGGMLTAFLQKRNQVNSIKTLIIAWPIAIFILSLLAHPVVIIILLFFIGIILSMIFAICRAYYTTLIPFEERAEYFSLYVIFERFGAVIGPIVWSSVVSIFLFMGEGFAYRAAMMATALITLGAFFVFKKFEKVSR